MSIDDKKELSTEENANIKPIKKTNLKNVLTSANSSFHNAHIFLKTRNICELLIKEYKR